MIESELNNTFNRLINDIYTVDNVNVISCLGVIFKEYFKHIDGKYNDNLVVIIIGGAPADVMHSYYHKLSTNVKDIDIATNMLPDQIEDAIKWYNTLNEEELLDIFKFNVKYHLLENINLNSKGNGTINIYIDNDLFHALQSAESYITDTTTE